MLSLLSPADFAVLCALFLCDLLLVSYSCSPHHFSPLSCLGPVCLFHWDLFSLFPCPCQVLDRADSTTTPLVFRSCLGSNCYAVGPLVAALFQGSSVDDNSLSTDIFGYACSGFSPLLFLLFPAYLYLLIGTDFAFILQPGDRLVPSPFASILLSLQSIIYPRKT